MWAFVVRKRVGEISEIYQPATICLTLYLGSVRAGMTDSETPPFWRHNTCLERVVFIRTITKIPLGDDSQIREDDCRGNTTVTTSASFELSYQLTIIDDHTLSITGITGEPVTVKTNATDIFKMML